jgi:P27 family predicted phage terminase small subunit
MNVCLASEIQTLISRLHSRSKAVAECLSGRKGDHMRKPKNKAVGLKEITSSLHQQSPGRKETKPVRILECPPELGPVARQEWDRIVGELTSFGVLSSFDRGPLAAYCNAYALWIEATDAVQKYGAMIKSPNGYPVQSPYLATVNRQAELMMRVASEFGFTPASRSRIFSYSQKNSMVLEIADKPYDESSGW